MKAIFTGLIALFLTISAASQLTISGTVSDATSGETLPGATVTYEEGKGMVTDIDGNFSFDLPQGQYTIVVAYVGMEEQRQEVNLSNQSIKLTFVLEGKTMSEVVIVSDVAVGRRTPVAFTDVSSIKIKEELGTRDLPMVLNTTPGIYATQTGGGDGDARINIRGFNQRYVAVMVDGIPMNDMENGWVYWSNWFGLDVVTQKIQVQRGLGASKLSIPSVGGTINIMSQGIDQKQKITISSEWGNNMNLRETVGYNSGRLKGGWGITSAVSVKKNNGWVENLRSKQLFYFLKVQKEFLNHSLSLSIMGSPQEHFQRPNRMPVVFYDKNYAASIGIDTTIRPSGDYSALLQGDYGSNHNQHWNTLTRNRAGDTGEEEIISERINYYHKPILNFRHFWTPTEKLAISNNVYASKGDGGGTRLQTAVFDKFGSGQIDFDTIYYSNTHAPSIFSPVYDLSAVDDTGQYKSRNYIFSQENNHFWAGVITTFKYQVNKRFDVSAGFDGRYYYTDRFQVMYDLLGGDYAVPNAQGSDLNDPGNKVVREGDIFGYKFRTFVKQGGVFFLTEYHKDKLTAFVNLTGSVNAYNRTDYFARKNPDDQYQSSGWKTFEGGTLKAGASYNINKKNSVFFNAGYLSRAQMLNTVFVGRSLDVYENVKNEEIIAQELGYSFKTNYVRIAANIYNTMWKNKPVIQSIPFGTEVYNANVPGMNALHQGIELEAEWVPAFFVTEKIKAPVTLEIAASVGDWRWTSNGLAIVTDELGVEVTRLQFGANGVKVGDAAQTQFSTGIRFEPIKNLYIKPRFTYFDNYYADFDPESLQNENANRQSWKIPSYYQLDINLGYSHELGKRKSSIGIRVNLLNVTDLVYISDARNNDYYNNTSSTDTNTGFNAQSAGVFMGMGFRWNVGVNFTF